MKKLAKKKSEYEQNEEKVNKESFRRCEYSKNKGILQKKRNHRNGKNNKDKEVTHWG